VTSWKLISRYGNFIIFAREKKKAKSNFWLVKIKSNSLPNKWSNYLFIGNYLILGILNFALKMLNVELNSQPLAKAVP
jgi:hypothetical protein